MTDLGTLGGQATPPPNGLREPMRQAQRPPQAPPEETLRDPVHSAPRVRRRRGGYYTEDKFHWPKHEIPPGSSYEWKRYSVMGQTDPFYIASQREQGWEPVDPRRHPNMLPPDYNQPYIIRDGMLLMERPIELTQDAVNENQTLAYQMLREAEQRLGKTPAGEMTREHPEVRPRLQKQMMRPIPVMQVEDD